MEQERNIFTGLKVVDLASYIAGPAATTILSDFGADVIKVEPPESGDLYRYFHVTPPNPASEHNYAWQLTNCNKRSLALDLKSPGAKEVLARLVPWADVLVTNFPPNVKAKLGLTYEAIAPLNARVVYADITGYGSRGPEADKPGFDITAYWARTGLMQVTRDEGCPPTLPVPGVGDHATASTLYSAIVTGLYRRERTGLGSHVSTSLIADGAWAAAAWIEGALHGAKFYGQHNRKRPPNALLNTYRTVDDRWLLLVVIQQKDWIGFAKAMGMPELLSDPRFADGPARACREPKRSFATPRCLRTRSLRRSVILRLAPPTRSTAPCGLRACARWCPLGRLAWASTAARSSANWAMTLHRWRSSLQRASSAASRHEPAGPSQGRIPESAARRYPSETRRCRPPPPITPWNPLLKEAHHD
jgi:crotonobetainyl-CoA:carnitine CoA-transferase CaiB-like acyl-CoA transferase